MPQLVDTTIRLLSQGKLAGEVPTGEVLRIAEILDRAGFACLEVSGGGVFDAAVRRAVESPWERIRALDARTTTPLGIALRGRFLVGSKPSARTSSGGSSPARRRTASTSSASTTRSTTSRTSARPGEAIVSAGKTFHAGLVFSSGKTAVDTLVEQAKRIPDLGATRVVINDPTDALKPHLTEELVERIARRPGFPVGLYVQGAAGTGLLNAVVATRVGADLVATAVYPLALILHRVSGESLIEALHGLGPETGVDIDCLWEAADLIDEHIGDEPVAPMAPRIAVRAAEHDLPAGLVAALDMHLRAHAAGDRLLDTLDELGASARRQARRRSRRRSARSSRPRHGQRALREPLRQGQRRVPDAHRGRVRGDARTDRSGRSRASWQCGRAGAARRARIRRRSRTSRDEAGDLAASEEDLVLLAMFGEQARTAAGDDPRAPLGHGVADRRRRRLHAAPSGSGRSCRSSRRAASARSRSRTRACASPCARPTRCPRPSSVAASRSSRPATTAGGRRRRRQRARPRGVADAGRVLPAADPGAPPFVAVGDVVAAGADALPDRGDEALQRAQGGADGLVRAIHVDNAQPVEYGQLLFELEPVVAPADALTDVLADPRREPRRDRRPGDSRGARARDRGGRRSTRPPTRTRCTCGLPTGASASARRPRPTATCGSRT